MKYTLAQQDRYKWVRNLLVFLIPVGILYLTTVIGVIEQHGGAVSLDHFIPSQIAVGGMTLYILNGVLDFLRKFLSE